MESIKNTIINHLDNIKSESIEYYNEIVSGITKYKFEDSANMLSFLSEYLYSGERHYFTISSKDTFNDFENTIEGHTFVYSPLNDHSRPFMHKGDLVFCYRQGQFGSLEEALDIRGIYAVGICIADPKEIYHEESGHNRWGVAITIPVVINKHLELRNIQLNPTTINLTPYNGNRNDSLQYIEKSEHYNTLLELVCARNPYEKEMFEELLKKRINDNKLPDDVWSGAKQPNKTSSENNPLQQIFYGAPGTGKSHTIDEDTNEDNRIRTTFHPDYDYATFVGAYKPMVKTVDKYGLFGKDTVTMKHEDNTPIKEDVIIYNIKAYVEAWRRYADAECAEKDFYLVIEEINRGNCAQIFGDLFQLLDRTNKGFSSYAVETESDLQSFLTTDEEYKLDIVLTEDIKNDKGKVIATAENVMNGKVLVLPPNLHIWATMNTSDQSLFPIDSAFKRRWDWKYVPIKYGNKDWKIMLDKEEVCEWTELQRALNDLIYDATESEDKMLGDWFVKADDNIISEEVLVGKIIFYLWNDVAKVDAGKLFDLEVEKNGRKRKVIFSDFYKIDGNVDTKVVEGWLKSINAIKEKTEEDGHTNEPEQ